jgi:hypothetical protein
MLALQQTQQSLQQQSPQQQQVEQQQPQQHQELLQYLTRLESQVLSLQQQVLLNQWAQQATSDGGSTHAAAAAAAGSPQQDKQQQGRLGRTSSEVQVAAAAAAAASPVFVASPAATGPLGRAGGHTTNQAGAAPAAANTEPASAATQRGGPQGSAAAAAAALPAVAAGNGAAAAAAAEEEEAEAEETSEAQPLLDSLAQQVLQLQNSLRAMLAPEGSSGSQQQPQLEDEAWQEEDHPVSQQDRQQVQAQTQGQQQQPGYVVVKVAASSEGPSMPPRGAASTAASSPNPQLQQQPSRSADLVGGVPGAPGMSPAASPDRPTAAAAATSAGSPGRTAALFAAAAAAAPVSPSPRGHTSRAGSTAGSLATAAAGAGLAAVSAGSDAVLQRLTDMEVSMLANAHGLQALQDRLTKLEQRPALLPQQQPQQQAHDAEQQHQALSTKVELLVQQVQGLQDAGADLSNAAATAAAEADAAALSAASAAEAAAAAVAAGQVVQQQEGAVLTAVEEHMQMVAAAMQDSAGARFAAVEAAHLQVQQEAVGFAGQLQQLQEQQQALQGGQDVLLARQQQQGAELDAGRELQQQLADRLQVLEPLQQQVRVLQEVVDAHAAASCAAADASAAAAADASDEVGRVREDVRLLATRVDDLQLRLQHDDDKEASAGADLGALSLDVEALQAQLQGVQGAVTALQEQQQQAGSQTDPDHHHQQQQQAQQCLVAEVSVLSGRVGQLAAELAACSEAVSLTLPLRLVEVEDRVAATAQTCAEAVKVSGREERGRGEGGENIKGATCLHRGRELGWKEGGGEGRRDWTQEGSCCPVLLCRDLSLLLVVLNCAARVMHLETSAFNWPLTLSPVHRAHHVPHMTATCLMSAVTMPAGDCPEAHQHWRNVCRGADPPGSCQHTHRTAESAAG